MSENLPDLSTEQLRDALDAKVETIGRPAYDPEHFDYFEDMGKYGEALASIGKDPTITILHELAHGRCALAVGAIGVKHGIEYRLWDSEGQRFRIPYRPVTSILGPSRIPHLGLAAIAAAPAAPSQSDLREVESLGYPSLEYLERRIAKWNRQDNGLIIPLPGMIHLLFDNTKVLGR